MTHKVWPLLDTQLLFVAETVILKSKHSELVNTKKVGGKDLDHLGGSSGD